MPLSPVKVEAFFDLFGADFIGPFEEALDSYRYIFNVVDYFSRFI